MILLLLLVGLALGSFMNALVWRLHQRTVRTKARPKPQLLAGRSQCERCGHQLAAIDLIPVLSWLLLRGRCRYCHAQLSWHHPAVEGATATLFIVSLLAWPYPLATPGDYLLFCIWLSVVSLGMGLVLYDLHWMLLPNKLLYPFFGFVSLFIMQGALVNREPQLLFQSLVGSLCFGGFFYILYQISRGRWIGGGDVRLGFALGILLGWQKSILCLALAAYLGTIVIGLLVLLKKYHKKMKLPFGPFLLTGAFCAMLWGSGIIEWYLKVSGIR